MILVIDNYDSFVETLARYARELGFETRVCRNDGISVEDALSNRPSHIILSPGPGRPEEAGIMMALVEASPTIPILGVCLGHQGLCSHYGGDTIFAPEPMHGRASDIFHEGDALFAGVPSPFAAGRYHSLLGVPAADGLLETIAWGADGTPMAVRHRRLPHVGVQFHPESILTPAGRHVMDNFLKQTASRGSA